MKNEIPFKNSTNTRVNIPYSDKKKKAICKIKKSNNKCRAITSSEKKANSLKKRMQAMNMNPSAVKFELDRY